MQEVNNFLLHQDAVVVSPFELTPHREMLAKNRFLRGVPLCLLFQGIGAIHFS